MRLVATSDTHHTVDISTIPDGDVFVHAGDLCQTGYPDDWAKQLEWLAALPHKLKLYVPGNHDFHIQLYPGPALQELRSIGVWVVGLPGNIHFASHKLPNGMSLLGLPFVTNLPRWAFNVDEEEIEKYLKTVGYHDIIVSHAPPRYCLDKVGGNSVGIGSYWEHAATHRPKHWIFGHIHEGYGNLKNEFLPTEFHNVAMCDRTYTHANKPLVLDL
jgi:Calcineurin-like phosphoesterase